MQQWPCYVQVVTEDHDLTFYAKIKFVSSFSEQAWHAFLKSKTLHGSLESVCTKENDVYSDVSHPTPHGFCVPGTSLLCLYFSQFSSPSELS
jgi:hypothetical protein